MPVAGGWPRHTTVVELRGGGLVGSGEDVIYDSTAQRAWQAEPRGIAALCGRWTLAELSHRIDGIDVFPAPPADAAHSLYRRWALESAALALALAQAETTLGAVLGREVAPVRYVVSLALGDPPSLERLSAVRALYPAARFKVDLSAAWDRSLIEQLAALDCIDVVDLKGLYRGAFQGPPANAAQYRWIAELLPKVWLEDPEWTEETRAALAPHVHRVTWDANQHALSDLIAREDEPRCVNIKPSRFGFLAELLRYYAYCEARGIRMYGGGQFELDVGRAQNQALAALFHADAPNDLAPSLFNESPLRDDLPPSPLRDCARFS